MRWLHGAVIFMPILMPILGTLGLPTPSRAGEADGTWAGAYVGFAPGFRAARTTWSATELNGGISGIDSSSPRNYDLDELRIGGFAGFNWQHERWVFGPEFDFAWADDTETRAFFPGCAPGCFGFTAPSGPNDTTSVRMKWDGGVRGRVGYLVEPTLLLYGTGGLAVQDIETTGACHNPTLDSQYCFGPGTIPPIKHDLVSLGFSIGGGVETKLYEHWSLRAEYRFAYFPRMSDTFEFPPGGGGGLNTYSYNLSAETHTMTLGIAYRF